MNKALKAKIVEQFGTQSDFAVVAGIDEPTVSRVIRWRKLIDPGEQKRWADLLDCEVMDIFNRSTI